MRGSILVGAIAVASLGLCSVLTAEGTAQTTPQPPQYHPAYPEPQPAPAGHQASPYGPTPGSYRPAPDGAQQHPGSYQPSTRGPRPLVEAQPPAQPGYSGTGYPGSGYAPAGVPGRQAGGVTPQPQARGPWPSRNGPQYRLAENRPSPGQPRGTALLQPAAPNEHPLVPLLRWARDARKSSTAIKDYTAVLVKRERIDGELGEEQYLFLKLRHEPFSAYTYFMAPASLKGQEAIYIDGKNNGEIWAHGTGVQKTMFGTVSLNPTGRFAMRGQRYPITEIGMVNILNRVIEVGEKDLEYAESEVQIYRNATLNGRGCTCVQVTHPVPRSNFLFHIARIFIDDEWNLPVRYEAYDWPQRQGDAPELIEQYTYVNVKLNAGLKDADFDIRNPNYSFR